MTAPPLHCGRLRGRNYLSDSPKDPQDLAQDLAHGRCSERVHRRKQKSGLALPENEEDRRHCQTSSSISQAKLVALTSDQDVKARS